MSLGRLNCDSVVGLHKLPNEFLARRLGEHSFFPDVGDQEAGGLGGVIEGGLGKVAQDGSAAPG